MAIFCNKKPAVVLLKFILGQPFLKMKFNMFLQILKICPRFIVLLNIFHFFLNIPIKFENYDLLIANMKILIKLEISLFSWILCSHNMRFYILNEEGTFNCQYFDHSFGSVHFGWIEIFNK